MSGDVWQNISRLNTTTQYVNATECLDWAPHTHSLFHAGSAVLCLGLFCPLNLVGVLLLHALCAVGFLLWSIWSWVIICGPDYFSWNLLFVFLNIVHIVLIFYRLRPVKLAEEYEDVYEAIFQPLRVSRDMYKRLVNHEYCSLVSLHRGEHYATDCVTKTDKLGLLVSGVMAVYSNQTMLHKVYEKQFIDSPEYESHVSTEEKYQVSIIAEEPCEYLCWPRHSLDYLLLKDPYLGAIVNLLIGRDITNKLYSLNEKVPLYCGNQPDIRLPPVSSSIRTGTSVDSSTPQENQSPAVSFSDPGV